MAKPRPPKTSPVDGLLVVDKPTGPTSHDVVQWARRVLGTSQVGHTGTLDPMASGVLVLGVGQGTKLMAHLGAEDKRYETTLRLGRGTTTLDAEGEVDERRPVPAGLTLAQVRAAAERFVGTISQQAPVVSAIKQGGRALHERARAGEVVDAPFRDVLCHAIDVLALTPVPQDPDGAVDVSLALHTGKGFYVRSLGRDLAAALGTVGHLVQLRRTQNGAFDATGALDGRLLAGVHDEACRAATRAALLSLPDAVASLGMLRVDEHAVSELRYGRALPLEALGIASWDELPSGPVFALLDAGGELVALGERRDERVHVVRGFPPKPNTEDTWTASST
ncbi:MAG: tRNA pseudouridine(55) synthase TruB [Sandaracinaceae bacterium]|nr:tRNA pseudouridine(55) synthase TruB [Sandaracinaceae bacterium]